MLRIAAWVALTMAVVGVIVTMRNPSLFSGCWTIGWLLICLLVCILEVTGREGP